jgi:hypothetical protein
MTTLNAMFPVQAEHPKKRRNLLRWRMARLDRLNWEKANGRATPRQLERINQLWNSIQAPNQIP